MNLETMKKYVCEIASDYPIKRVVLFGSRADGSFREGSDVDLMMEFTAPVTLLTISRIKLRLEKLLQLSVDIVHGPLREGDLLEIHNEVEIRLSQSH